MGSLNTAGSRTLAESVESSLLDYIRSENLTPGDVLPKEQELAEELKVSRQVVREGLAGLKTFGILETRKRRGMVVRRPNAFAGVSKLAQARLFSERECREFMQIRVFMELGMAEFIFEHKTPEDMAELRELAGPPGHLPTIQDEIAFHHKLFSISRNAMGGQFLQILTTAFSPAGMNRGTRPTPEHADLCDALEGNSWLAFYEVLKKHFVPYLQVSFAPENVTAREERVPK